MIELINFSKKYSKKDEKFAVENISLKAEKGITCLLGLNGAGKSTIIKAICNQHFATSGKILVSNSEGIFFDCEKDIEKTSSLIGYIPEISKIPENITVIEFLYNLAKIYFNSKSEIDDNLQRTVKDCQIQEVLTKKIGILSKGFKQRVLFAQALIHNPENLIFDESVNGLDPAQILQFRKMIKNISKNKTVLLSTHLMQEVHSLADKIYILSDGKISASGTEDEIIKSSNSKNIEEAFIKFSKI